MRLTSRNGVIAGVYTDKAAMLVGPSILTIRRASNVVPQIIDGVIFWRVDLALSGGCMDTLFTTRDAAIAAEIQWLENQ